MSQPRIFLEALFSGKPAELLVLLWTLPEKDSRWYRAVEDAIRCSDSFTGHDLYIGIGFASRDYGLKRRCPSEEVAGIVGLCADLDLRSDAHPKPTLPETTAQALSILPQELEPSFVISTGNGLQAWFLFREPYVFHSDDDRRAATSLVNRWHTLLRDNARRHGWTYDRLSDLARVLRVPGTTNCKDPSNRKPVSIESQSDRRYNPSELADYLDGVAVPDPAAEDAAAQEWTQRFRDHPLTLNLAARIQDDRLRSWLEADPRFKNTWFRQRQDLSDQSQSGYDLALACFGFGAGLTEQEIVDLIVHHRALHKQKQRTSLDYFQRTISKADPDNDRANEFATSNTSNPASAGSENGGYCDAAPGPDGAANKEAICKGLSEALGVQIYRITKIGCQSAIYHMELAEGKVEFSNVSKLISQTSIRNTLAAMTGKLMRHFKPPAWKRIAQALLDACTAEEGGEEMELEGNARLRLVHYLSAGEFIDSIDGQSRDTARKPMIADGFVTVCASDIQTFINRTTTEKVTIQTVVSMLSAVGAKSKRFRGKFPEQSRWLLPPDKFAPADYAAGEELSDDSQ